MATLGDSGVKDEIKLKIETPRIEIALGSISSDGNGPYVAVAMLHLPDDEVLYQPLMPLNARKGESQLDKEAAGDCLAELYDFICQRWGTTGPRRP